MKTNQLVRLAILAGLLTILGGCVASGYHTKTTESTAPDGTVSKSVSRDVTYTDTRQVPGAVSDGIQSIAGDGGVLDLLKNPLVLAGGGTGVLGVLGVGARLLSKLSFHKGHDAGWEARQAAATTQQILPVPT